MLDIARLLLVELGQHTDCEIEEKKSKLEQLKTVLEMWVTFHLKNKHTHTYHHSSPSCHLSHQQISRLSHTHKQTPLPWRRSLPLGLSLTALSFLPSSIPLSHPPILPFFTHLFSQKGIQLEWQSVRTLSLLTCKGWGFTGLLFFSQPRLCVQNIRNITDLFMFQADQNSVKLFFPQISLIKK